MLLRVTIIQYLSSEAALGLKNQNGILLIGVAYKLLVNSNSLKQLLAITY